MLLKLAYMDETFEKCACTDNYGLCIMFYITEGANADYFSTVNQ